MWCDSQSPIDAVDEREQSFNKYIVFLFNAVVTRWSNNKINCVKYSTCGDKVTILILFCLLCEPEPKNIYEK